MTLSLSSKLRQLLAFSVFTSCLAGLSACTLTGLSASYTPSAVPSASSSASPNPTASAQPSTGPSASPQATATPDTISPAVLAQPLRLQLPLRALVAEGELVEPSHLRATLETHLQGASDVTTATELIQRGLSGSDETYDLASSGNFNGNAWELTLLLWGGSAAGKCNYASFGAFGTLHSDTVLPLVLELPVFSSRRTQTDITPEAPTSVTGTVSTSDGHTPAQLQVSLKSLNTSVPYQSSTQTFDGNEFLIAGAPPGVPLELSVAVDRGSPVIRQVVLSMEKELGCRTPDANRLNLTN